MKPSDHRPSRLHCVAAVKLRFALQLDCGGGGAAIRGGGGLVGVTRGLRGSHHWPGAGSLVCARVAHVSGALAVAGESSAGSRATGAHVAADMMVGAETPDVLGADFDAE